jgi:hypothetical protein
MGKKEKFEKMKTRIPEDVREHHKKAREEIRESVKALFPEEFITRRRAARKEMLLAAQKMIGHAIDRLEKDKE